MPYYVYKIIPGATPMIKSLEKIDEFAAYKDAKNLVKQMRSQQSETDNYTLKVMFADNELAAEEQLQATREAPILQEWEK